MLKLGIVDHKTYLRWCLKNHPDKCKNKSDTLFKTVTAIHTNLDKDADGNFKIHKSSSRSTFFNRRFSKVYQWQEVDLLDCTCTDDNQICGIHTNGFMVDELATPTCVECQSRPAARTRRRCEVCIADCVLNRCIHILPNNVQCSLMTKKAYCFFHIPETDHLRYIDTGVSQASRCGPTAHILWPRDRTVQTCRHQDRKGVYCVEDSIRNHRCLAHLS